SSESEEGEETYIVYTSDNKDAILRGQKRSRFILQLITKWLTEGFCPTSGTNRSISPGPNSIGIFANYRYLEVEKSKLENQLSSLEKDLEGVGPQLCKDKEQIQNKHALLEEKEGALMEIQQKIADLENVEYADYNNELQLLINEIEERDSLLTEIDQGVNENDLGLNKLKSQEVKIL
uniref:Uncharacterized protein n=1 Tax=Glossina pallidipes TaxID=7398 RepID=A0A1A9ZV14_GLOPL